MRYCFLYKGTNLIVDGKEKKSTDITYDDLLILYDQYIKTYNEVPVFKNCDAKHNMPQGRIISKLVAEQGLTYKEFVSLFGKTSNIHTFINDKDYDYYKNRFIEESNKTGHALKQDELSQEDCNLPSATWFVKYCPEDTINTYDDFVKWCGFESNKLKKDKDKVIESILLLSDKLDRPLQKTDITLENVGFTPIVISRIFGSFNKMKEELGLPKSITSKPRYTLDDCKNKLDRCLSKIKNNTNRMIFTWKDIENAYPSGHIYHCEHKTLIDKFKKNDEDVFAYIKAKGFDIKPSNFYHKFIFDDGEMACSTYEYDFSSYLKELGYEYNIDYYRNVAYKTFIQTIKSKINCDYKVIINNTPIYIEIAGIIKYNNGNWKTTEHANKINNSYRDKMIKKEELLKTSNVAYLILFPEDFTQDQYKEIILDKINEVKRNG